MILESYIIENTLIHCFKMITAIRLIRSTNWSCRSAQTNSSCAFDFLLNTFNRFEVLNGPDMEFCVGKKVNLRQEDTVKGMRVDTPPVASSSTTINAQGCSCSAESVHYFEIRRIYNRWRLSAHQMIDTALNGFAKSKRFSGASDHDNYFACIKYGSHTNGESHARYGRDVAVKETGIGKNSVVC